MTSDATDSPWFICFRPVAKPALRIVCFPYAGAGASAYRLWHTDAPDDVEVLSVQLPGRETRIREPRIEDIAETTAPLADVLRQHADAPLVLFGHSMGAAIVHDLTRSLIAGGTTPRLLVFSGRRPGHLPAHKGPLHTLEETAFLEAIRTMGGTPPEVFEHPELLDVLMPILRSDFRMSETFARPLGQPFPIPMLIVSGAEDAEAPPDTVSPWRDLAGGPVEEHVYPDGHFFIHTHRADLIERILKAARYKPKAA